MWRKLSKRSKSYCSRANPGKASTVLARCPTSVDFRVSRISVIKADLQMKLKRLSFSFLSVKTIQGKYGRVSKLEPLQMAVVFSLSLSHRMCYETSAPKRTHQNRTTYGGNQRQLFSKVRKEHSDGADPRGRIEPWGRWTKNPGCINWTG